MPRPAGRASPHTARADRRPYPGLVTDSDQSLSRVLDLQATEEALRTVRRLTLANTIMLVTTLILLVIVLVVSVLTRGDLSGFLHDMRSAFLGR